MYECTHFRHSSFRHQQCSSWVSAINTCSLDSIDFPISLWNKCNNSVCSSCPFWHITFCEQLSQLSDDQRDRPLKNSNNVSMIGNQNSAYLNKAHSLAWDDFQQQRYSEYAPQLHRAQVMLWNESNPKHQSEFQFWNPQRSSQNRLLHAILPCVILVWLCKTDSRRVLYITVIQMEIILNSPGCVELESI